MLRNQFTIDIINRDELVILMMIPSQDQLRLMVNFESLTPKQHFFNSDIFTQRHLNVSAFHVNLCSESRRILSLILKIEYVDTFEACRD